MKSTVDFKAVERKIKAGIALYGDTAAKKLENKAKQDRKWTDRTSHAKNSLQGSFGWQGKSGTIALSGGMEYSVYLELAMGKKYAVIVPTVQAMSKEILSGYKKVIG